MYVIVGNKSDQFWQEKVGYGSLADATYFSKSKHAKNPGRAETLGGHWVPLWELDVIQFARLLSEMQASGILTPEALDVVAASMDLELDQIDELITRAETLWERSKEKLPK